MKDFEVLSYTLDQEAIEFGGDAVGTIVLKDKDTGEIHNNAIWFDEDGDHYFCWDTGEFDSQDREIIEDDLLCYHTDYMNPKDN